MNSGAPKIDPEADVSNFYLDVRNERLLCGEEEVLLRPKAFALLQHMARNPGHLLTKDELLGAVWPDVVVGEEVLKGCIRELRQALGDHPKSPRFIQTHPRRGYRLIGSLQLTDGTQASPAPVPHFQSHPATVFGRRGEMQTLEDCLERALRGERQIAFVVGENGIGKTALVDTFLEKAAQDSEILIAYGQCQELFGKGEAYMPVLEALERVGREAGTERLIPLLNRHAPTWLVQMSSLIDDQSQEALLRRVARATPGRMLREIAMALEALTTEIPLVLVLEDLHWSDYSTVDFISSLARRREAARLLLIGTYRPMSLKIQGHPLKAVHQSLRVHRQCVDLDLSGLDRRDLEEYLGLRLGDRASFDNLVDLFFRLTAGNPLFLSTMLDDLLERGQLVERAGAWQLDQDSEEIEIADSLQQMIQEKLETLSEKDQRLLEAASVAGMEFSAAVIASVIGEGVTEVEMRLSGLADRGQFLRGGGQRTGGEQAARYAFSHALHQNVLYQRLTVARRVQLHRKIGEALEATYEDRPEEVTAALATHFERGRTHRKAVEYHVLAAQKAIRRSAYREAVHHLNRGLDFMKLLPDNDECRRQELALQGALGSALVATRGYGVEEVGQSYLRACEVARGLGRPPGELQALWGLALFRVTRAEFSEAGRQGEDCLQRAGAEADQGLEVLGHYILGMVAHYTGTPAEARRHLELALDLRSELAERGDELEEAHVHCRSLLGLVLWVLGRADEALERCDEAVKMARRINHPMSRACARHHRGMVHYFRHEADATRRDAEALLKISSEYNLPLWAAWGNLLRGWARSTRDPLGSVPQLFQALASWRATGARTLVPTYLAVIASAFARSGDTKMGLSTIDEALDLVREFGERSNEAELLRLKGKLLQHDQPEQAEACLRKALAIARRQHGLSWVLWVSMSLSRLLLRRGEVSEARELLSRACDQFDDDHGAPDLQVAQSFLQQITATEARHQLLGAPPN